jgi:hypothetical protein
MTGSDDRAAGFLVTIMVDGCVHVEQLSVDPGSVHRGRELPGHAARQAAACVAALTLTTFADVPWNAPHFARYGFRVLDDAGITAGLRCHPAARKPRPAWAAGRGCAGAATHDDRCHSTERHWPPRRLRKGSVKLTAGQVATSKHYRRISG